MHLRNYKKNNNFKNEYKKLLKIVSPISPYIKLNIWEQKIFQYL